MQHAVAFHQVREIPNRFAVPHHYENPRGGSVGDQRVSVRQPLRARPVDGVKGMRRVGGVCPNNLVRPVAAAVVQTIGVAVGGQGDLVHGRVAALEPRVFPSVVENEDVARPRRSFRDPMRVVRKEEALIVGGSSLVRPRIAPAVKEVAALAAVPAGMPGGLFYARGAVDDPYLAEVADGDHNLIEFGVVIQCVGMRPIGSVSPVATRRGEVEVDVDAFGMVCDHAVVRLAWIEILNKVVERRPLPDDVGVGRPSWTDFDDMRRIQSGAGERVRVGAEGDGFLPRNDGAG